MLHGKFSHVLRTVPVLLLAVVFLPQAATLAANDRRCFPEAAPVIRDCIEGRFRAYWAANGGLAVFGYPISPARPERNRDTGATYLTQYFERQRFELHPENAAPYDVLLGRLGDDRLRVSGRDWRTFPKAAPTSPNYSPETGHAIAPEFFGYWDQQGLDLGDAGVSDRESLALFGFPLSEPLLETNSSGDTVLTQYFERARLEYHPQQPANARVLQGRLGSEIYRPGSDDQPQPSASGSPQPSASPEPGDDNGASPAPSASASPEPSDDHGGDDDRASPAPSASASPQPSDDHGGDDDRASPSPSASPEPGDDRGRDH